MKPWFRSSRAFTSATVLALAGIVAPAWAQLIVEPLAFDRSLHRGFEPSPAPGVAAPLSSVTSALASGLPLLQRGPIVLRPRIEYRAMRNTGMNAAPGRELDTTIQSVAPGVAVAVGDHWNLNYTGTWSYYSNDAFKDGFDQAGDISGRYALVDWTLEVSGRYSSSHPVLVETSRQSHETSKGAGIQASRAVGLHSHLDLALAYSTREANPLTEAPEWIPSDSREWSSSNALRLQPTQRLGISAGFAFGDASPTEGPGSRYTRPELRVSWTPSERTTLEAQAGVERRTFRGADAGAMSSPVYRASFRYRPMPTTSLLLEATRGTTLSYLRQRATRNTGGRAAIEQRLFGLLYLSVGASRQKSDYIGIEAALPTVRSDHFTTYDAALSVPFLQRGAVSLTARRTENDSSQSEFSFTSSQIGLSVSLSF